MQRSPGTLEKDVQAAKKEVCTVLYIIQNLITALLNKATTKIYYIIGYIL